MIKSKTSKITLSPPIPNTYPNNISKSDPWWKVEDHIILQPHHVGCQQGNGGGVVGI